MTQLRKYACKTVQSLNIKVNREQLIEGEDPFVPKPIQINSLLLSKFLMERELMCLMSVRTKKFKKICKLINVYLENLINKIKNQSQYS